MTVLLKVLSIGFLAVGLLMLIGTIGNYEMIEDELTDWLGMLFFMSLLPTAIGALLWRKAARLASDKRNRKHEALIIAIAQAKNGKITSADVAVESDLTVAEGKKLLHEMYVNDLFSMHIEDEGQIVYELRS